MSVFKSERSESSLQNSEKRVIPGVPTTLVHEVCKESLNVKRGEKTRERLFTFRLSSADLPSI